MLEDINEKLRYVGERNGLSWLQLDAQGVCGAQTQTGIKWQIEWPQASPWLLFLAELDEAPERSDDLLSLYELCQTLNFPGPECLLGNVSIKPGGRFFYLHYRHEIENLHAIKLEELLNQFLADAAIARERLRETKNMHPGEERGDLGRSHVAPPMQIYMNV
ncbi:CesT family type III secretion system chaperone [Hahella aquimaris]|uniref:CesT family type III secretion system chaperone n=1 Tax=Hahella sp. HNIBRBA332 TaxID=3015983 RepID=UPI00273B49DF|nr:CesT family type III secretion system chaperone [Hahella sp. HNIBRBA332]WLQ13924.1 CesT family type III secretion system chaperone [Hahella sp. HNIBRBA332]